MQKVNCLQDKWHIAVFSLVALVVLLADQLSKIWIRAHLQESQTLFDLGFLRITNIHNTGAAFGLFPQHSLVLSIVAFIGIPAVLICAVLSRRYLPFLNNMLGKSALGLVLGGTIGNLIDRLGLFRSDAMGSLIDRLRFGYVTDFIDFRIWPTFNIADSAITIGIIIVAYSLLRLTGDKH